MFFFLVFFNFKGCWGPVAKSRNPSRTKKRDVESLKISGSFVQTKRNPEEKRTWLQHLGGGNFHFREVFDLGGTNQTLLVSERSEMVWRSRKSNFTLDRRFLMDYCRRWFERENWGTLFGSVLNFVSPDVRLFCFLECYFKLLYEFTLIQFIWLLCK